MANKLKVALLCGGKSAEHSVSLLSAQNVYNAINKEKFDCTVIGIGKDGKWSRIQAQELTGPNRPTLIAGAQNDSLPVHLGNAEQSKDAGFSGFDVVFPILHGQIGEDGSIQGLLRVIDVPYVGSNVLGSAVGMDKDVMKRLLRDAGIPIGKFLAFRKSERNEIKYSEITDRLGKIVFVKPANQGSSIGISRVTNADEFEKAVELAFRYDGKIVIEENISGRELECGVIGNSSPIASVVGEIVSNKNRHEFYSYEAKYFDENGAAIEIPASIPDGISQNVRHLALQVFNTLCCEGLSRVDFFLKADGQLVVNEINTIPGFTKNSMFPKLWEYSGINYSDLIERLLLLAIERHESDKGTTIEIE